MKRVLIIILSIFLMVISISSFYGVNYKKNEVNAVSYTGKVSYSTSKPLNNQGFLSRYNDDIESITFRVFDTSEYVTISKMKTSNLTSVSATTLYNYLRTSPAYFNVPIDFEIRFGLEQYSVHYPVSVQFEVISSSVVNHGNFLSFNVRMRNSTFGSFVFEGEILERFLELFSYKDGYKPSIRFYLNIIDSSFSQTVNWIGINPVISLVDEGVPFSVLTSSRLSVKLDFRLRNTYRANGIYVLYADAGFRDVDFLYGLSGATLNLSFGVNDGEEIFAYASGTTKKNFASDAFYNDHLLLTFDDYVRVNSIQLYLYSILSNQTFTTTMEVFEYGVLLQYLQLYDLQSNVIIPGDGYSSDRLINYKSVEWYDIPGHLSNFLVWLIYDCPIISPLSSMIYTMFSFSDVFIENFLLFNSLGVIFVILAGIFGLMIIVKTLKE